MFSGFEASTDFRAGVIFLQNDVDDTGDRIGAVDGGGAIGADLDMIDHTKGYRVQVDKSLPGVSAAVAAAGL